ncbi:MAG TPA: ferritin-like domain-containing protein [Acidobacteriota bacterium]
MADKTNRRELVEALRKAYFMELETVLNYLANSIQLDGVRAEEIKKALAADIPIELEHARRLANRIKQLHGRVPGSLELDCNQKSLQPPKNTTNVIAVIQGVIDAEKEAIAHYNKVIRVAEGVDYVTQDLAIQLLGEEEAHLIEFEGFLKEYRK